MQEGKPQCQTHNYKAHINIAVVVQCQITHQQVRGIDIQGLLHLEGFLTLHGGLLWPLHHGLHIVLHIAKLPLV